MIFSRKVTQSALNFFGLEDFYQVLIRSFPGSFVNRWPVASLRQKCIRYINFWIQNVKISCFLYDIFTFSMIVRDLHDFLCFFTRFTLFYDLLRLFILLFHDVLRVFTIFYDETQVWNTGMKRGYETRCPIHTCFIPLIFCCQPYIYVYYLFVWFLFCLFLVFIHMLKLISYLVSIWDA